jgi:hypothetical protein
MIEMAKKVVFVVVGAGKYKDDGKDPVFKNKKQAYDLAAGIRLAGGKVFVDKQYVEQEGK